MSDWIKLAKVVLRNEYSLVDHEYIDEWPTVDAPETLFTPRTVRLRADIGILRTTGVPKRERPRPNCQPESLKHLVAVVEVGDLQSPRKLEQLQTALGQDVRVIWIPKLDLLDLAWPNANQYRYKRSPFTREAALQEVQQQIEALSQLTAQNDKVRRDVAALTTQVARLLRASGKAMQGVVSAFGDASDWMERRQADVETLAKSYTDVVRHTSGLAYEAQTTPQNGSRYDADIVQRAVGETVILNAVMDESTDTAPFMVQPRPDPK